MYVARSRFQARSTQCIHVLHERPFPANQAMNIVRLLMRSFLEQRDHETVLVREIVVEPTSTVPR